MRTRCSKKRLASQGRGLRPGSACMCQADAHTPLQTRAVRQKGLASQGRGLRPGSARNVSGRCAHPAANAGGATKETCEPGARFASRLSPQCVRPMRTPRCKRGRCDKRDLRARGAMCVQAQPGRGEETRTPDILLPKQARYQLRYTSEKNCYLFYRLLRRKSRKSRRIRALRGKFPFSICSALFSISRSRFMVL